MAGQFSAYRDCIKDSLSRWPEFSCLNRFLQTSKPANAHATSAHIFDLVDNRLVPTGTDYSAASFSENLAVQVQGSRVRVVLICHGDSWDVDREIVDVACSNYGIDPRFVARHFDHSQIRFEKNCPRDLLDSIEEVNNNYYEHRYSWDHGGLLMSPLSVQLGSCYSIAYKTDCLSIAVHHEGDKISCEYIPW